MIDKSGPPRWKSLFPLQNEVKEWARTSCRGPFCSFNYPLRRHLSAIPGNDFVIRSSLILACSKICLLNRLEEEQDFFSKTSP